jgi:hypothetical protein
MNEHHRKREDREYQRKGTCSVVMVVEPLGGRKTVKWQFTTEDARIKFHSLYTVI